VFFCSELVGVSAKFASALVLVDRPSRGQIWKFEAAAQFTQTHALHKQLKRQPGPCESGCICGRSRIELMNAVQQHADLCICHLNSIDSIYVYKRSHAHLGGFTSLGAASHFKHAYRAGVNAVYTIAELNSAACHHEMPPSAFFSTSFTAISCFFVTIYL
jgi:hypothetical protein